MLPGMKTHANCIRFCPYLLKLKPQPDDKQALIELPYRLVFAVATIDHVIIYSTQSVHPLAVIKNLHYDSINDLAWMKNKILMVASSDGYCSFIKIEEEIIGEILEPDAEAVPEFFREHFKILEQVNFERKVEEANRNKQTSFTKIAFKSKKPAPQSNALEAPSASKKEQIDSTVLTSHGREVMKMEDNKDSWCGPDNSALNQDVQMKD